MQHEDKREPCRQAEGLREDLQDNLAWREATVCRFQHAMNPHGLELSQPSYSVFLWSSPCPYRELNSYQLSCWNTCEGLDQPHLDFPPVTIYDRRYTMDADGGARESQSDKPEGGSKWPGCSAKIHWNC